MQKSLKLNICIYFWSIRFRQKKTTLCDSRTGLWYFKTRVRRFMHWALWFRNWSSKLYAKILEPRLFEKGRTHVQISLRSFCIKISWVNFSTLGGLVWTPRGGFPKLWSLIAQYLTCGWASKKINPSPRFLGSLEPGSRTTAGSSFLSKPKPPPRLNPHFTRCFWHFFSKVIVLPGRNPIWKGSI